MSMTISRNSTSANVCKNFFKVQLMPFIVSADKIDVYRYLWKNEYSICMYTEYLSRHTHIHTFTIISNLGNVSSCLRL